MIKKYPKIAHGSQLDAARQARTPEQTEKFKKNIPEVIELERLINRLDEFGRVNIEAEVSFDGLSLPIYSLEFGLEDPSAPVVAFIGGVHGLERIGSNIIIEFLKTFKELLYWDQVLQYALKHCRIVFMPIVNPVGVYQKSRCNGNGIDLMRNAPVDSQEVSGMGLVCGHRLSNKLPWYRGSGEMELESITLCNFVKRVIFPSDFSISLDLHSGFGRIDRLWFPYASSRRPFESFVEMYALKRKLDQALPNHVYRIEPQTHQYLTHGDLWDFLDLEYRRQEAPKIFLPLTLEMGSWQWIKKNPRQLFSMLGPFHPMKPHRTARILRRHIGLLDFLIRASMSHKKWSRPPPSKRSIYSSEAMKLWY